MSLMCRPQNAAAPPVRGALKPTKPLFLVALLTLFASTALGQNFQGQNDGNQGQSYQGGRPMSAPEIDPAQAMGFLALLGGTMTIIRGYRRKEK